MFLIGKLIWLKKVIGVKIESDLLGDCMFNQFRYERQVEDRSIVAEDIRMKTVFYPSTLMAEGVLLSAASVCPSVHLSVHPSVHLSICNTLSAQ